MAYSLKIVKYDIALEVLKILSKIVTVANTYYLFLRYFLKRKFGKLSKQIKNRLFWYMKTQNENSAAPKKYYNESYAYIRGRNVQSCEH